MLNEYATKRLAKNTVRNIRAVLRAALNVALSDGLIDRNPAEPVKVSGKAAKEKVVLTAPQAVTFLSATKAHRLGALWAVALSLGMRQGEILGLTWDAVNLSAGTIYVREPVQRVDGEYRKGEPKSNAGKRMLKLPPPLVASLKGHKVKQNAERLAAGPNWTDHNLVFATASGDFLNTSTITHLTQRLLGRLGLPRLTFHELRHSAGTFLGAQGLGLHEIADILGHTDIRIARIYTHTTNASKQKAADAMGALLGAAMGG